MNVVMRRVPPETVAKIRKLLRDNPCRCCASSSPGSGRYRSAYRAPCDPTPGRHRFVLAVLVPDGGRLDADERLAGAADLMAGVGGAK
jgi:hypothetical protein